MFNSQECPSSGRDDNGAKPRTGAQTSIEVRNRNASRPLANAVHLDQHLP